ncbi:MAG: cyclic nucleotide-binding domain-containing protein, partial [Candidatus Omnitrophica bacterium]|nr:cyclic nucleotide-binding domain-containing protein [Candidatus Omnitrophota bacterium]
MEGLDKNLIIQEFPLFSDLSPKERAIIRENSSVLPFKKGDIIYKEGSGPSGFYCLGSGRVVTYVQDSQGNQTTLEYLHRGKYFGIISLLTNEPHSVTAQATNDCLILVIDKEAFNAVINKIPRLAIDLSLTLSR